MVACPFCRRPQEIDGRAGRITCRHCGNGFSWDDKLRKTVILSPGSSNKSKSVLPRASLPASVFSFRSLAAVAVGVLAAIIVALFFIQQRPVAPVEKGAPNADLEEIDKQLKSLAE